MTVLVRPDVRIARAVDGLWYAQDVALITMVCCGAQVQASRAVAPGLASMLDGAHSCGGK